VSSRRAPVHRPYDCCIRPSRLSLLSYPSVLNALPSLFTTTTRETFCCCSRDAAPTLLGLLPTPSPPPIHPIYRPHPLPRLAPWSAGREHRIHRRHTPPSSTCCRNTASTARARSQAPPTETSLTFALPLARHSRASPWTQTTPCRHLGMLHHTSASTLARRTSSTCKTTRSPGTSPHGKPLRARSLHQMARRPPLACMPRTHMVCKNLQSIFLQNISCHLQEPVRDASEMTTALPRSLRVASTQDELHGRQTALVAETAEYMTGLLCRHSTIQERPQERAATTM
jgi:hypothetical protein